MSGGGSGVESALGVIAPIALSAMFPEIGIALGSGLGDLGLGAGGLGLGSGTLDALGSGLGGALVSGGTAALTGGNPLTAALLGGLGSGVASELGSAGTAAGAPGTSNVTGSEVAAANDSSQAANNGSVLDQLANPSQMSTPSGLLPSLNPPPSNNGTGSNLANWLGKSDNLKNVGIAAGFGLPALQGIMQQATLPKFNVQKNANSVMATNPDFNNPNLPRFAMNNTALPYPGNWYTYGERPEAPMFNARPIAIAKHGGLMGYAHGGRVRGYAAGGMPLPQAPMPPQGKPVNPLMLKAVHEVGVAVGKHLKGKRTPLGQVHGAGGGQDDAIPAKLSDGEYIVPAEAVSQLGDGSSDAGGKKLDQMVHNIRTHKTSKGSQFPPKAKNPLSYVNGGQS